jgi:hypothetical protein
MKAKLKSPDLLKQKGQILNIKLLKKLVKDGFQEPLKFFYDTEFDFGEEKLPILYIGESVPTAWKKYIKTKKKEKTFAAGNCITDENGHIKLVVEIGKGAKAPVLKIINKELLKKCKSKAYFVESIDAVGELEEPEETADDAVSDGLEEVNPELIIMEIQDQIQEGMSLDAEISPILDQLEAPLGDIKNTIVTDDLIKQVEVALSIVGRLNYDGYTSNTKGLLNSTKEEQSAHTEVEKSAKELQTILDKVSKKIPSLEKIIANSQKVKKVENPMETEFPPISDDPFETFANKMTSFIKSSIISKDLNDLGQ